MEPKTYFSVGTTARANPVNNNEILFSNGYDRNQTKRRQLVLVHDTATDDDQGDYVNRLENMDSGWSSSPSENVTVTIKFSSGGDGIVTETDRKGMHIREEKVFRNRPLNTCSQHLNRITPDRLLYENNEPVPNSVTERVAFDGNQASIEGASSSAHTQNDIHSQQNANINPETKATDTEILLSEQRKSGLTELDHSNPHFQNIPFQKTQLERHFSDTPRHTGKTVIVYDLENPENNVIEQEKRQENRITIDRSRNMQNSLFDEYERFVEPSAREDTSSMLCKSGGAIPKVKALPIKDTANTDADIIKRCSIVSPVFKTPIVRDDANCVPEEGEDFMSYLKELKRRDSASEDSDDEITEIKTRKFTSNKLEKIGRHYELDDGIIDLTFSPSSSPTENAIVPNDDVVTVSDEEYFDVEETIDIDNMTLVEPDDLYVDSVLANFTMTGKSHTCAVDNEEERKNEILGTGNNSKKRSRAKQSRNRLIIIESGDEDTDEDSEDETDSDNNNDDLKKREDDSDSEGNGNAGSGSSGNDNSDDNNEGNADTDEGSRDDNHNNDDFHVDDNESGDDNDEGSGTQRYYSPGVRSRSTDSGSQEQVAHLPELHINEINVVIGNDKIQTSNSFEKMNNICIGDEYEGLRGFKNINENKCAINDCGENSDFHAMTYTEQEMNENREALSDDTESLSPEDKEVFDILDYCECLNKTDCKFQTISIYAPEESDNNEGHNTKDEELHFDEDVAFVSTKDEEYHSDEDVAFVSPPSEFKDDGLSRFCVSPSSDIISSSWSSKDVLSSSFFNGETSDPENFNSDPTDFGSIETISMSDFSRSTSYSSPDYEQQFEIALEHEVNTMQKSEQSDIDAKETIAIQINETLEILRGLDDYDSNVLDADPVCAKTKHKTETIADTSISQSIVADAYRISPPKQREENDVNNNKEALFTDETESSIFSENEKHDINKYVESDDDRQERFVNAVSMKYLKHLSPRTISYFVPYFIDTEIVKVDPKRQKRLKLVCKLRKALLPNLKVLNTNSSDSCSQHYVNVGMSISELESTLNELKLKSKNIMRKTVIELGENEDDIPGRIRCLGYGFYIFGTGTKLDLPVGPRLKENHYKENGDNTRSRYFRGVPGIINHAYKMSHFTSPKLVSKKDTSSRRILHACNRLATQVSQASGAHERRRSMMINSGAPAESSDDNNPTRHDLIAMLNACRDALNASRFDEAETAYLKLYHEIQEKPEDNGRMLVETLSGLADICIRRSRMCRSNPLEWQWLCMHAIALLQYIFEFCDSELETQLDNEVSEWFREQKRVAELKCRPLEDAFTRALYNCLKHDANFFDPFQSFSLPSTPGQQRKGNVFPLSSTMPQYLLAPTMTYRMTDKGLAKQNSEDVDVAIDWLAKFEFYCKDRLQTKDHTCVTEKILRSTRSKSTDEETESVLTDNSEDSLDWDHSDLKGIEEMAVDLEEKTSPVNDYSLELELATSDSENEGWDFFLHQRRNCDLQSVVQVSADDEKRDDFDKEIHNYSKETQDVFQKEKNEKSEKRHKSKHEKKEIVSPLHAHSISLTLARSFCRLADKLVHEEEYKKAEVVYEKILDIIDAIQDGTAGMLRFSARIMKNLGTVKSKQGKSSSGLVLLNKALNTYRDLQDEEANFEIAVALIELGNGYIVGKNHEDSVFNDVIIAICDFFEKDAGDSQSTSNSSSVQSHISQMTSSLASNSEERNVEEALTCYSEALLLLDAYEADEKQIEMFAKAVMRLGDCHFMQKDYDKALECYEKALGMFRSNNIFGKDSLMENAHVLCMLGVSSFMLHVYPRAASVFETALHMVRCAYGFKRTFLNGMLQSLSGITYYKMKNYHKCVSMCYQGYETYCELFGEAMCRLDKQKFWLVCQTLYVMGNSYNILSLQQKALKYLTIARSLMKSCKSRERRQFMRVLQILGDCYFAQYDYKVALTFYNEALEYGECESQISFDEVFDPNCASDEMTIHNHLVSKSAEAHLSMQQYQNAVHYLEQAHDMQEVMGEDIKGDLISTLHQLGHMHSAAGDVNKAIESYKECLEVFREIHKGQLGPEMCTTLGNLAAICYVKACIADDYREEQAMNESADAYFQEAMSLETNAEVCVKYGSFLYSQCHFQAAVGILRTALSNDDNTADIVYRGLEKVTLPELLQDEVDTQEEICLPSSSLARYLLILCHKAQGEMEEAEVALIDLLEEVWDYDIPILHSLLGYAMMELNLWEDAALSFRAAAETEEDYQLAHENYCICLLILVHRVLTNSIENIYEYICKRNRALSCILV